MNKAPQIAQPTEESDPSEGWSFVEELSTAGDVSTVPASEVTSSGTGVPSSVLQDDTICSSPVMVMPFTRGSPTASLAMPEEEPTGNGSWLSGIINLLATTMGAGLLSLPKAFAHCGVIPGVVLLFGCGWAADMSLQFLVVCARASRRHSFEGNAEHYLGHLGKRALNTLLLVVLFFAAVAMVVIISQLLPDFIQEASGQPDAFYGNAFFIAMINLLLIFPVCLKEEITILRYTSALALCNLAYYFICLNIRFFGRAGGATVHRSVSLCNWNFLEVMQGFSIMVAAYLSHFNIFKIDAELARPMKPYIWRVIDVAIPGIATTLYISGGLLGYFLFGQAVSNNMLEQFPDDPLMNVARVALSLTNLFKLPLIVQPLRESIYEAAPSLPKNTVLTTATILVVVYIVAMALGSLSKALGILGCTAGMAIAFVLPGLIRLQYRPLAGSFIGESSRLIRRDSGQARLGAKFLVVGGTFLSLSAVAGNIILWNKA
jgi:amino acid permease